MSQRTNFVYFEGQLFRYEERNAGGKTVSSITLRLPSSVKGKDSAFVTVEAWSLSDDLRNTLNANAGKGRISIQGELRQDSWLDKKTQAKRSKLFVSARHVSFIGPWKDEEPSAVAVDSGEKEDTPF